MWIFLFVLFLAGNAGAKTPPALNPTDPASLCDRFILAKDLQRCEQEARRLDLDWYAASVCNLIENDEQFLKCWADMDGKVHSPTDLVKCTEDMEDEARRECLRQVFFPRPQQTRTPSSHSNKILLRPSPFQEL